MPRNLYDQRYKAMFDHPPMVEDLLRFVFQQHSDFLSQLDFTTLSRLPGDLITEDLQQRLIDRAWRVNFVNSKRFVCFVLEFQTRVDPHMGLRLATYSTLLLESLIKNKQNYPSDKCTYPPILPIVLYNSGRKWSATLNLHHKFTAIEDELKEYLSAQRYLLVQEKRELIDPLPKERSLFAGMLAIVHNTDADRVLAALRAVDGWLDETEHVELRQLFADLFLSAARERFEEFEKLKIGATMGELKNVLAESMDRWPDKWVQQGRIENIRMMLHRQLEQKFGPVPESTLETIDSAAYEQLERWTDRVIGSTTLQQIFSD